MHEPGLDVKNPEHRERFRCIINDIIENPDEKRHVFFAVKTKKLFFTLKAKMLC